MKNRVVTTGKNTRNWMELNFTSFTHVPFFQQGWLFHIASVLSRLHPSIQTLHELVRIHILLPEAGQFIDVAIRSDNVLQTCTCIFKARVADDLFSICSCPAIWVCK